MLEAQIHRFLSSLPHPTIYPGWYLYPSLRSLTCLGKAGDEFEPGLLLGNHLSDPRVVFLDLRDDHPQRILVARYNNDHVVEAFTDTDALRRYLASGAV